MRVADLNHMEARVDVNENDVVNVKVGDKANVKIDAYGDRKFHGTVYQIANTGTTTGSGTQEEVTNFEVKSADRRSRCAVEAGTELHRGYRNEHGEGRGGGADAERSRFAPARAI